MDALKPQLSSRKSSLRSRTSNSQNLSVDLMAAQAAPPCGPRSIEVAISFDTTGSMSQCLEQVQAQVNQMIERLFMDIPDLKIAVIAHGDYCDEEHFYVTQHVDFTNQLPTLATFVKDVGGTGGGDWEECYEYVLNLARTKLSWTPGTQRALVMIGDAAPHPPDSESCRGLDWRKEVEQLNREMGVSVYGVQCLKEDRATPFWVDLAARTGGRHLQLDEVSSVVDMIMAIVYREHGAGFFEAYEQEVRAREGAVMRNGLEDMFQRLRSEEDEPAAELPSAAAKPNRKPARKVVPAKQAVRPKTAKAKQAIQPKPLFEKPKVRHPKSKNKTAKAKREPRQARETVQQSHFVLNSLKWSPWQKAMSLTPCDGTQWRPRRAGAPGFRSAYLFTDSKRSKPAVYEFAVQTGARRKMHVVFFRCTKGIPTYCHWDRHLLQWIGHYNMRDLLTRLLQQKVAGCKVLLMVRRAILPRNGVRVGSKTCSDYRAVTRMLKARYDYAWRLDKGPVRENSVVRYGRYLEKDGCVISS
ncbi:hypothetical protein CAPTEDRAFT_219551 [Capitella teleta]|uniref:VWFA domain-containing protein n=1 Tax=Capitella teleta TaxID=283909 RepID=R7VFH8_CAPTE|nr:hypothetical protein CAPTEDRAFT_219551 [Capitella teleta]|eukprot:ELU17322.1 hypothetical protein CAPTEDRAFT_219551 [Capitella teleta]